MAERDFKKNVTNPIFAGQSIKKMHANAYKFSETLDKKEFLQYDNMSTHGDRIIIVIFIYVHMHTPS